MKVKYIGIVLFYLLYIFGILSISVAILKISWLLVTVGTGLIIAAILFKKEFKLDIFPWRDY